VSLAKSLAKDLPFGQGLGQSLANIIIPILKGFRWLKPWLKTYLLAKGFGQSLAKGNTCIHFNPPQYGFNTSLQSKPCGFRAKERFTSIRLNELQSTSLRTSIKAL
jgi:hypothetical protein